MKQVAFTKDALRSLRAMPTNTAKLIRNKISQYASDPASLAVNVVKLQGRRGYRLRVGGWRVIFDDDGVVLAVLKIAPRGSVY